MQNEETKGITVKVDASLHAEVKAYLEEKGIKMAEFVAQALRNELHPQNKISEENHMENMRTMAFQIPESLFQRIKDYLQRNNLTQKQFILGLITDELKRDQAARQAKTPDTAQVEEVPETQRETPTAAVCEDGTSEFQAEDKEEELTEETTITDEDTEAIPDHDASEELAEDEEAQGFELRM